MNLWTIQLIFVKVIKNNDNVFYFDSSYFPLPPLSPSFPVLHLSTL